MREGPEYLQFIDKLAGSGSIQQTCSLLLLELKICLGKCLIQVSDRMMSALNSSHDSLFSEKNAFHRHLQGFHFKEFL